MLYNSPGNEATVTGTRHHPTAPSHRYGGRSRLPPVAPGEIRNTDFTFDADKKPLPGQIRK